MHAHQSIGERHGLSHQDGTEKVVEQVLVTGKGLAKLSQAMGMH